MAYSRTSGFRLAFSRIVFLAVVITSAQRLANAQSARQLAQNTFPSVVLLVMQDANGQPISLGSGFFVAEGTMVTNLHVVRGASSGQAKVIGKKNTLTVKGVVGVDPNADIVLLDVGGLAPALTLNTSNDLAVGDVVYAVGNPEGLEGTFSQGIVSGIRTSGSDKLIQITAPISPGSSGGPIINSRGEVVGVAVATFKEGQNLNFAVPASAVASLLKETSKPRPLASVAEVQANLKDAQIFNSEDTQGVVGTDVRWANPVFISFAILNKTGSPVTDVHFLVVFFTGDKKHGFSPIDYVEGRTCPNEVILPNLPRRQDNFYILPHDPSPYASSCEHLYTHSGVNDRTRKAEVRVLDFKLGN